MKVAVIMGSSSDAAVAQKGLKVLDDFGIEYEVRVISAHRALPVLIEYVETFDVEGIEVVIAIAGKAAHLPGVIAGMTILPVIGVPVYGSSLNGLDALLSIVSMPKGVPVATVALDATDNAAILATQILALKDAKLRQRLQQYKKDLLTQVMTQDRELRG